MTADAQTTIEHRLFSELPHTISKLNEADDGAEVRVCTWCGEREADG